MDIFQKLPMAKRSAMELLFQNCTEKVKNYMFTMDVVAGQTFIQAGEPCINIVIILSGRASGVEWPMHGHSYPFKDFGPGDFLGEIESFAGMRQYRVSVVALTDCRVLAIPVFCYMEWMHLDVDALYMRTQKNVTRLLSQTAEARKYLFMDGRERLMLYLIRKYERHGRADNTCSLKQTRSQMAEEIGFSIKTMDRSIKKLEEDGMLRLEKGKIQVDQSGYLEMKEYIEQCIEGRS